MDCWLLRFARRLFRITKGRIQVDVFDVQLGSALLIQLWPNRAERPIRVLADAGVSKESRYSRNHVQTQLRDAFSSFGDNDSLIDLVVGTHYDADHLRGLVDVAENHRIGEAWLPPVANDTEPSASTGPVPPEELLPQQFAGRGWDERLRRYLETQLERCDESRRLAYGGEEEEEEGEFARDDLELLPPQVKEAVSFENLRRLYAHDAAAERNLPEGFHADGGYHGAVLDLADWDDLPPVAAPWASVLDPTHCPYCYELYHHLGRHHHRNGLADLRAADAAVRKSTAKKGITATWLAAVVQAFRRHDVPIPLRRAALLGSSIC